MLGSPLWFTMILFSSAKALNIFLWLLILSLSSLSPSSLLNLKYKAVIYFFFYYIKNKDKTNLLTDIKGNKLPVGNSKEEKNIRKRNYLKESLVFSIVVMCLDLMSILILNNKDDLFKFSSNNTLNIILNIGLTFVLCFIISYLLDMLIDKIILKKRKEK